MVTDQPWHNCAWKEILQRFLPVKVPSHLVERSCTVRVLMSKRFIDFLFSQGSKLTSHTDFVAVCNHCITHNPPPIHLILLSKGMYCARTLRIFIYGSTDLRNNCRSLTNQKKEIKCNE